MGFAIPAMHYTAMAAVSYTSMAEVPDLTYALDISALANTAHYYCHVCHPRGGFVLHRKTVKQPQPNIAGCSSLRKLAGPKNNGVWISVKERP